LKSQEQTALVVRGIVLEIWPGWRSMGHHVMLIAPTPLTTTALQALKPEPAPRFSVYGEQRPVYHTTEWRFVVQDGQHRVTMEGTKANWRWIQARAQEHNIECEMPQEVFDSLPESGDVTFTTLAHIPHAYAQ
jgi:hypothetical protein